MKRLIQLTFFRLEPNELPTGRDVPSRATCAFVCRRDLADLRAAGAKQGSWRAVLGLALAGMVLVLGIVALIVYKFPAALPQRTH